MWTVSINGQCRTSQQILKRATFKGTVITIISPLTESASMPDSLHSLRQDVWHCHVCPLYGIVGPALTLSPSPTNAIDGALLLDCLHRLQCRVTWSAHISFHRLTMARRGSLGPIRLSTLLGTYASVAEWLRAWDTLTMFEATVCGKS